MSGQNARIRQHLVVTCTEQRTKNRFRFGEVEIIIDHDSPIKGVHFRENVIVSIWDAVSNTEMRFSVPVSEVEFIDDAL